MLDPFASSGSSLLAARMLGRDFIGIEIDSGYQAIAERRLASGGGAQQDNSEFSIYRISESYQILEDISIGSNRYPKAIRNLLRIG